MHVHASKEIMIARIEPVLDKPRKEGGQQVNVPEKGGLKWKIVIDLPKRGQKVKRPRKTKIVHGSERKARKKAKVFEQKIAERYNNATIPREIMLNKADMTFGEYCKIWLKANEHNFEEMARRTWESYAGMLDNHIIPLLGHIPLIEISAYHISLYLDKQKAGGNRKDRRKGENRLSYSSINKQLAVISNVLRDAASPGKQLIPFNPAKLVDRLKSTRSNKSMVNCLQVKELNSLLKKLEDLYLLRRLPKKKKEAPEVVKKLKELGFTDKEIKSSRALFKLLVTTLHPIVYLTARTGMRLSEVLALKWKNIDYTAKVIRVFESSHFGRKKPGEKSGHHIRTTKEGKPKAYIEISDEDVLFLKRYRKEQVKQILRYGQEYTDNDLVFASNNGSYLQNNTIGRIFSDFANRNNFGITFHGLRHTHVTMLLAAGVPIEYVARRVGHQQSSTTSNSYSHVEKISGANLGEIFALFLRNEKDFTDKQMAEAEKAAAILLK